MSVKDVLSADVLHVGKLIFGQNIPHLNKLDGVTARDVHQDGGEVADPLAVTQLLFNLFLHLIRHAGITRVKNAASVAGDWVRQTDQRITETSMARTIQADTERRELISRETTVKATDKTSVLGTSTLMAGAVVQVSAGDYSQAVKGNWLASVGGDAEADITGSQTVAIGQNLTEKICKIRKSVATAQQQIIAPVVWIGSDAINVAQLMLDTLDALKQLAEQTASHTHSNTGVPTNAAAIKGTGTQADNLAGKYSPVIGK